MKRTDNRAAKLEWMQKALHHREGDRVPISDFFWGCTPAGRRFAWPCAPTRFTLHNQAIGAIVSSIECYIHDDD